MATSTLRSPQAANRIAVLASADLSFRQRVRDVLTGLRWQVREASGGAEALAHLDSGPAETLVLDSWLPDLEIQEFISEFQKLHPTVDLVSQRRVTLDDSITRLTAAGNYDTAESTQFQSAQDTLIQANTAQVATQLSSAETQQSALTQVIAAIEKQGTLFNVLQ
jgi:DNA-binding NtrC family response regulator